MHRAANRNLKITEIFHTLIFGIVYGAASQALGMRSFLILDKTFVYHA